jgi:hypothetical protein
MIFAVRLVSQCLGVAPRGCWAPSHGEKVGSIKRRPFLQRGPRTRLPLAT